MNLLGAAALSTPTERMFLGSQSESRCSQPTHSLKTFCTQASSHWPIDASVPAQRLLLWQTLCLKLCKM